MYRTLFILTLPGLLGADWPQHLGPTRDGKSPETGLARTWPKAGPPVIWKIDVGSGWAGVAVAGERLILFHRLGDDEVLDCRDPASGKVLWSAKYHARYVDDFRFDDGPRATPLIADGRVYTFGADGDLRAWNLTDGKAIWDRNVNKDYNVAKGYFGSASSPILAGGKLILNVGGKGASIVAFDPATGKEIWKAADDPVSYSSPIMARVGGAELVVFLTRSGLLGVTPDKGEVYLKHPFRPRAQASVSAAAPVVAGDRIFLTTAYSTGAILLNLNKGKLEEVWQGENIMSCQYNTPILIDKHLYGVDGRADVGTATLNCVEWNTGKVKWSKEAFGCAGLIHADNLLIASAQNGDVVLIDPSSDGYQELGRAAFLESPVRALPALSNGRLFIRDAKKLMALDVSKK
ncbi:MAG TPA: PQQ-binding-like beta-propeller repeat protein [Gemmataceae bacterium]|jgi:outer membrane protein assembly factor BamB|nr:PQQ-binding-like beta-propeller repeat protein [Gemmataceae bacterium]